MIDYFLIILTMVLVFWLMQCFKLLELAKTVMAITSEANGVLLNKQLSDLEKEQHTQQMTKKLMVQFFRVMLAAAGVFLLPLLPLYALSALGFINLDKLFDTMMSIPAFVLVTVLGLLWWWVISKRG